MGGRLEDKTAIVVGAGSIGPGWGNGKATAVTFAREGARVLCVDINEAAAQETVGLIEGEGGVALAERADVTDKAQVDAMVARARALGQDRHPAQQRRHRRGRRPGRGGRGELGPGDRG